MKDFINKLELAFDKQLADKTNYGRNQVKELFLRACIEVLAETDVHVKTAKQIMDNSQYGAINLEHIQKVGRVNRVNETPSKEESKELFLKHKVTVLPKFQFTDPKTGDEIILKQYRWKDNKHWSLEFTNLTTGVPVVKGETMIEQPMFDDILQLYYFYKEQLPF